MGNIDDEGVSIKELSYDIKIRERLGDDIGPYKIVDGIVNQNRFHLFSYFYFNDEWKPRLNVIERIVVSPMDDRFGEVQQVFLLNIIFNFNMYTSQELPEQIPPEDVIVQCYDYKLFCDEKLDIKAIFG